MNKIKMQLKADKKVLVQYWLVIYSVIHVA